MIAHFLKTALIASISFLCVNVYGQDYTQDAKKMYNIIKYANSVVGLNNVYTASLSNYQRVLTNAAQNLIKVGQGDVAQLQVIDCNALWIDQSKANAYHNEMGSVLDFSEKRELDRLVSQAENISQKILSSCGQMGNYFSQGQYTNDVGSQRYLDLKYNIINDIHQSAANWSNVTQLAVTAANEAEIALLRYNKQADFVIPMKTDVLTFKGILNMFGAGTDNMDYTLVRRKVQEFESSLNSNKNLSGKDLSKLTNASYQNVYQEFYQSCLSSISVLNKLIQQSEFKSDQQEILNTFKQANSIYSAAVNTYNTFAQQ